MNDDELRELIQQELEHHHPPAVNVQEIVRTAVQETLITMGMDVSDPLKLQQDMAFLRELRQAHAAIKKKGILVLVGIVVTALAAATWLGIKASIH